MADRMRGKVVLVSGAGSALGGWSNGKAAAVLYAREGASVLLGDVSEAAVAETKQVIDDEGGKSEVFIGDVRKESDVRNMVERCVSAFGRIDVLHNNVAIFDMNTVDSIGVEEWDRFFDINVKGVLMTCKHAIPRMIEQGGGAIVNVSTISSIRYTSPCVAYSASKAAVNQLTQSIAGRYGKQGIRANCVVPGYLETPLITTHLKQKLSPDDYEANLRKRLAVLPSARMGTPWDVAQASLFLASDDAGYINGVQLNVDGGMHFMTLTTDTMDTAARHLAS
jgi:NAD(P)-dependent dehydrogenase (short-subunit alcohol dehydrogenase family)